MNYETILNDACLAGYSKFDTKGTPTLVGIQGPIGQDAIDAVLKCKPAQGLRVDTQDITDEMWAQLEPLRNIRSLSLNPDTLSDRCFEVAAKWSKLRELEIECFGRPVHLKTISTFTQLTSLSLYGNPKVDDQSLRYLAPLQKLRHVTLGGDGTKLSAKGLSYLAKLPALKELHLQTKIGDAECKQIAKIESLERLHLAGSSVAVSGLKFLRGLGKLKSLNFAVGKGLTDSAFKQLSALASLEELDLFRQKRVNGKGISALSANKKLKVLRLDQSGFKAQNSDELAQLAGLEELGLGKTDVGDSICEALAQLPKLKKLNLDRSNVSLAALEQLLLLKRLESLDLSYTPVDLKLAKELLANFDMKRLWIFGTKSYKSIGKLNKLSPTTDFGIRES